MGHTEGKSFASHRVIEIDAADYRKPGESIRTDQTQG